MTITGWRSQLTFGFEKGRQAGSLSRPRVYNYKTKTRFAYKNTLPLLQAIFALVALASCILKCHLKSELFGSPSGYTSHPKGVNHLSHRRVKNNKNSSFSPLTPNR